MLYWGETLSPDLVNFGTMTKKIQAIYITLLIVFIGLSGIAMSTPAQPRPAANILRFTPVGVTHPIKAKQVPISNLKSEAEPTSVNPNPKAASTSLDLEAGNSDWIVILAILIVAIVVIPIMIQRKEWNR